MKKLPFIALGIVLLFTSFSQHVVAQTTTPSLSPTQQGNTAGPSQGLNLTLSPTYISLTTDPGKDVESQFRVTNNNGFTENLRVSVAKLEVGQDGRPVLRDMEITDEFGKWISVADGDFSLGGNQSKVVRFTISPPQSAALGYYYTLLVSRQRTGSQAEGAQAVISGSAGITVLLDVRSPNAKRELQVAQFATDKMFYEYLPTTFKVVVKNTGNVHVIPFGDIFLDSMFHKEIATLPANPGRGNVLPQSQREFNAVWDDAFAVRVPKTENGVTVKDGKGIVQYETKYDFSKANKFRIGKYTAHLIMVYDNGERDIPVEGTLTFWVIPWKIILGGIVVILTPAILVYLLMRWRYGRRK
jgi:hypothetical protein